MSLRDDLKRRDDVADDDIAEIIQLAVRLQSESDERAKALTEADVSAIAEELDIDPAHVEKAIELRRRARQEAAAEAERERVEAMARASRRKRILMWSGAGAGALFVLALLLGWAGARDVSRHHAQVEAARRRVDDVLDRFAQAAPQELALVGGQSPAVAAAAEAVRAAKDTDARLQAAAALHQAMTRALQDLPVPRADDPSASQMRLNVHYELVGFQNHITTESGRLDQAEAGYRRAASSLTGKLARLFGLAP